LQWGVRSFSACHPPTPPPQFSYPAPSPRLRNGIPLSFRTQLSKCPYHGTFFTTLPPSSDILLSSFFASPPPGKLAGRTILFSCPDFRQLQLLFSPPITFPNPCALFSPRHVHLPSVSHCRALSWHFYRGFPAPAKKRRYPMLLSTSAPSPNYKEPFSPPQALQT